ncbi:MAG: hypothetical protein LBJ93_03300 [Clostridiales bacterium]|nr:hypothetical protein [Clostridiales bacterium]
MDQNQRRKINKNPFILDSKEPTLNYQDFINQEVRYSSLKLLFPEKVDELFKQAENDFCYVLYFLNLIRLLDNYDNLLIYLTICYNSL